MKTSSLPESRKPGRGVNFYDLMAEKKRTREEAERATEQQRLRTEHEAEEVPPQTEQGEHRG